MFDYLAIGVDEFTDFVIEEDDATLAETTRWMVVALVLTGKNFSHRALFQQMQNAWTPCLFRESSYCTMCWVLRS
jgi:hypothetical protein